MRSLLLIFMVLGSRADPAVAAAVAGAFDLAPRFDLRVRQESLDGVYYFAPEPDRNWVRFRTRAGGTATSDRHTFQLLLTNEHRRIITPSNRDFDWDELIIDQAFWAWAVGSETQLTVGRQNIIWDRGFLVLEGHPLDGSRSIYQNALRLQTPLAGGDLDLALINNPKRDPIVLAGDQDRALGDADETAVAARLTRGSERWSVIWKNEVDPDHLLPHLQVLTLGGRTDRDFGDSGKLLAEAAVQYQKQRTGAGTDPDGFAFALQTHLESDLGASWRGKAGYFHYSGKGAGLRAFRTPWGRWPKWSELYIYTLIGESTPGRIHVAAWENIAGPHLTATRPLGDTAGLRLSVNYLLAPQTDWSVRGLMIQAEVELDLPAGLDGQLLWEVLEPGGFHDGRGGLKAMTKAVHFLRWQLSYALP